MKSSSVDLSIGHRFRSPDCPHPVCIALIVVVLVARVAGVPVLVPRVGSARPYTHTSTDREFHRQTGYKALSLFCSGYGPDQKVSDDCRNTHHSAYDANALIQP